MVDAHDDVEVDVDVDDNGEPARRLLQILRIVRKSSLLTTTAPDSDRNSDGDDHNEVVTLLEEALVILEDYRKRLGQSWGGGLFGDRASLARAFVANYRSSSSFANETTATTTTTTTSGGGRKRKTKRKTNRGGVGMDVEALRTSMARIDDGTLSFSSGGKTVSATLWLACLTRVLSDASDGGGLPESIVEAAVECITVLCERHRYHPHHGGDHLSSDTVTSDGGDESGGLSLCRTVERQVLSVVGVHWLRCLSTVVRSCLPREVGKKVEDHHQPAPQKKRRMDKSLASEIEDDVITNARLFCASACLKAVSVLVFAATSSMTTSRSSSSSSAAVALKGLAEIAWWVSTTADGGKESGTSPFAFPEYLRKSGTRMVSVLPLVGVRIVPDRGVPLPMFSTVLWTQETSFVAKSLVRLLHLTHPYHLVLSSEEQDIDDKDPNDHDHIGWMKRLPVSQKDRIRVVQARVIGLTRVVMALLQSWEEEDNTSAIVLTRCPLPLLLHACRLLVRYGGSEFSSSSSDSYDKSPTWDVPEEGYLLSDRSVRSIRTSFRRFGQQLVGSVLVDSSCDLLPWARTIHECLIQGMSSSVSDENDVCLTATRNLRAACLVLGSPVASLFANCVTVAAERLSRGSFHNTNNRNQHRHPFSERSDLVIASAEAMEAYALVCGGYAPASVRLAMESALRSRLFSRNDNEDPDVLAVLLRTAGALIQAQPLLSTFLTDLHRRLTGHNGLQLDGFSPEVMAAGRICRAACEAVLTPRCPPLHVPRATVDTTTTDLSSDTRMTSMTAFGREVQLREEDSRRSAVAKDEHGGTEQSQLQSDAPEPMDNNVPMATETKSEDSLRFASSTSAPSVDVEVEVDTETKGNGGGTTPMDSNHTPDDTPNEPGHATGASDSDHDDISPSPQESAPVGISHLQTADEDDEEMEDAAPITSQEGVEDDRDNPTDKVPSASLGKKDVDGADENAIDNDDHDENDDNSSTSANIPDILDFDPD